MVPSNGSPLQLNGLGQPSSHNCPRRQTWQILRKTTSTQVQIRLLKYRHHPHKTTIEPPVQKSDKSIDVRLELWKLSLDAIYDSPLWGHGSLYMWTLIEEPFGFQHNHNQYLSWLVTGGAIQLSFGLLFLATPWIISNNFSIADRLMITLSTTILWGFAMIFDSFFSLKFYTHYYCLLCGLLYAWANHSVRTVAQEKL